MQHGCGVGLEHNLRPQLNHASGVIAEAVIIEERVARRCECCGQRADATDGARLLIENIKEFRAEAEVLTALTKRE